VEFRIEPVEASATWALRQAVLRPHETVEQVARSDTDDDGDRSATFAALAPDGEVVGSVRVAPGRPPSTVGGLGAVAGGPWRLRGMATRDDARNLGIGTAVLARVLRHVQEQGGGLVWCNARVAAVGLYGRAGLVVHGEAWDDPDVGPHIVMWRVIESAPSATVPSAIAPSDAVPS
jgi:GNAT superfamily N-acetyltransferase